MNKENTKGLVDLFVVGVLTGAFIIAVNMEWYKAFFLSFSLAWLCFWSTIRNNK